jgi:hypothetical protein
MSTTATIALVVAIVFGILYVVRRRSRLSQEDRD